jgi:hypothetical protein
MNTHLHHPHESEEFRPLPRPAGAGPGVVAIAWPTGRLIYPYTPEELALGVDVYTRALKASRQVDGRRSQR